MLRSSHKVYHNFDDYQIRVENNEYFIICMQHKGLMDLARGLWITIGFKEWLEIIYPVRCYLELYTKTHCSSNIYQLSWHYHSHALHGYKNCWQTLFHITSSFGSCRSAMVLVHPYVTSTLRRYPPVCPLSVVHSLYLLIVLFHTCCCLSVNCSSVMLEPECLTAKTSSLNEVRRLVLLKFNLSVVVH